MSSRSWLTACLLCVTIAAAGCVPIPVSSVALHARAERRIAVESAPSENQGTFSSPVFDASGALLAVYDSGSNRVRILRGSDLTAIDSLKPTRWPRRLSFSPGGHFLVIETHQGWVDDYLSGRPAPARIDIDSPAAVRDDIQRVEIWNLRTGETIPDLSCDAVETTAPKGGWLWAQKWAITPGYRSSALLEGHFSADETVFSVLCWNGVQQRWDTRHWERLESLPPPPFWNALMGLETAKSLAGNDAASRSADGRMAILRVREKNLGFGTTYLWDRKEFQARKLHGECEARLQPVYALSSDETRIVVVCNKGLGYSIRAWNLGSGLEIPLRDADFGLTRGAPTIRGEGVALSPDGHYLAAALLNLAEALVVTPVPAPIGISRSDLRLWNLEEGRELTSVPIDDLVVHADYFRGVDLAFSPDNETLVVAGRRLRIYRLSELGAG